MNDLTHIEQIIANYLSGKASEEEKDVLTAWLEEDEDNLRQFRELKNIRELLHPVFPPGSIRLDEARESLLARLSIRKESPVKLLIRYWQQVAAVLLLPLLAWSIYLYSDKGNDSSDIAMQKISAPYGAHTELSLPDGSKVWINSGSSLEYPATFSSKQKRRVSLSGEAFFEVKSDKNNPFIVETPALQVEATGTAFNVTAYLNDSIASVVLSEGLVKVSIDKHPAYELQAGDKIDYNLFRSSHLIQATSTYKWYAWKDGLLIFRDDPLEYVFKRLGQIYNVEFIVKDQQIARQLYRATFEGETLDEILRLLKLTTPLQYRESTPRDKHSTHFAKRKIEVYASKG